MTKTTYQVVAATGYRGHKAGEEFSADLTEAQEKRAIARGSIRPVPKKPKTEEGKTDA